MVGKSQQSNQTTTTSFAAASSPAPSLPELKILVIEDEPTIIEFLRTGLGYEGHHVSVASNGRTGLEMALDAKYDLAILDLMLPDLGGFEICRRVRARGNELPIIMLTARQEVENRVAGLDAGADDYLTKPFSFSELLARMRAVLRRRGVKLEHSALLAGDVELNTETHEVRRCGTLIEMTPTEFSLLELLMRHPRRVFTKETLIHRVWGYEYAPDTNFVEVHIGHLREKLGDKPPRLIRTVYGVGYVLRLDSDDNLD